MTKVIEGGGPYNLQIILMESWCTIRKFHGEITRGSGSLAFIEKKLSFWEMVYTVTFERLML